jgi:predicted AAA+ superfamily ATPase
LENAFIIYSIRRYDIKGKTYLKTLGKYYMADMGIRNMLLGYRDIDKGHMLENVVFLELFRRRYFISIGKSEDKEIDFIAVKPNEKIYYQVAETIVGEETKKRELAPLQSISDNYRKIVLTSDKTFINSYDGIEVKNIIDFLLNK